MVLEIISTEITRFKKDKKKKRNDMDTNEFFELNYSKKFLEDLSKLENIIQILIHSFKEEVYNEVKSMILTEFENISCEISNYLELIKNEDASR